MVVGAGRVLLLGSLFVMCAHVVGQSIDCFDGNCGGSKGVPQCPDGASGMLITYANEKGDADSSCVTIVTCSNLNDNEVQVECRWFTGFNPIQPDGAAWCAGDPVAVGPGETNDCATSTDSGEAIGHAGGIFWVGAPQCEPFEGTGLVCISGDDFDASKVICQGTLVCGNKMKSIAVEPLP